MIRKEIRDGMIRNGMRPNRSTNRRVRANKLRRDKKDR